MLGGVAYLIPLATRALSFGSLVQSLVTLHALNVPWWLGGFGSTVVHSTFSHSPCDLAQWVVTLHTFMLPIWHHGGAQH